MPQALSSTYCTGTGQNWKNESQSCKYSLGTTAFFCKKPLILWEAKAEVFLIPQLIGERWQIYLGVKHSHQKIKFSLMHLWLAVVVRNHFMSHGVRAAVQFQKPLLSIFLSGFKSLHKGFDYNFNSLFTGCVDWRDLSCQVNSHLPVSCLAYSKKRKRKKKKRNQPPKKPWGGLSTGQPTCFLSKDVTWLSSWERKCRVMLQHGPSPCSAASREKGGVQEKKKQRI